MLSKALFSLVFLSSAAASAAEFNFDFTRRECINASGQVGRNTQIGVCSDQSGADLNSAQLSGQILTGSDFSLASLSKARLENSQLEYAILNSAYLDDVRLNYAKLTGVRAENAVFDRAILEDADLRQSILNSASFVSASLDYAIFNDAGLNFANLTKASLANARLRKARLREAKLIEISAESADFQAVAASGADFSRSLLHAANLRDADLTKAIFFDADLNEADLRNAILKGANLKGRNVEKADLRGAKFDSSTLLPFSASEAKGMGMIYDPSSPSQSNGKNSGEVAWRIPSGQGGEGRLIVKKDGSVYQQTSSNSNTIFSRLDTAKGTRAWTYEVSGFARELTADCIDKNKIFIETYRTVTALDSQSGKVAWTADLSSFAADMSELKCSSERTKIVFAQKNFSSGSTVFTAISKESGAVAWQYESSVFGTVRGYDDLNVYIESHDNSAALAMQTGAVRWQVTPRVELQANSRLYQRGQDGLRFIDNMTGRVRWTYSANGGYWNTFFETNNVLLQAEQKVVQLDADSGRVLWTFDLAPYAGLHNYVSQWNASRVSIALRNQAANWTRYIVLDALSGRQLWEKTVDSYYASFDPTADEGFLLTTPSTLTLLDPDTGKARWSVDATPYTKSNVSIMFHVLAVQNGKIYLQYYSNPPSRYPIVRLLTLSEADGAFLWQKEYNSVTVLSGINDDFIFIGGVSPNGPARPEDIFMEALVK